MELRRSLFFETIEHNDLLPLWYPSYPTCQLFQLLEALIDAANNFSYICGHENGSCRGVSPWSHEITVPSVSFSNDPFKRNCSKIKIHFLSQSLADLRKLQLLRRYMLQGASSSSFCPVWTLQEIRLKCSGNFRNFDPGVLMLFPLAAILNNSGISAEYHYLHSANAIEL